MEFQRNEQKKEYEIYKKTIQEKNNYQIKSLNQQINNFQNQIETLTKVQNE